MVGRTFPLSFLWALMHQVVIFLDWWKGAKDLAFSTMSNGPRNGDTANLF
jgi:hypothetical protein